MSPVRIIIQARLLSSRLPGKALLPIAGLPASVLCARRAGRSGLDLRLALPDGAADDTLAAELTRHGLPVVRGSETDVLGRFLLAMDGLPDDAIVVRLTADNVVPDGDFIAELVSALAASGARYLGSHSPLDGMPYGLSAEAFRAGALRAVAPAADAVAREHVTTLLRTAEAPVFRSAHLAQDLSHLRCTLDLPADYVRMARLFTGVADPIAVPWLDLCRRLASDTPPPAARSPRSRAGGRTISTVTLGTAQLGLDGYGIANRSGGLDEAAAADLLGRAARAGITTFDTARAYGRSEERLGLHLAGAAPGPVTVVTKLSPLADAAPDEPAATLVRRTEHSLYASCFALRTRRLDVVMLHRWAHRTLAGGAVWTRLQQAVAEGWVGELGASVATPVEACAALADPDVRHLQVPFNLLDYRWQDERFQAARAARPEVILYARSCFLQGLLLLDPAAWPKVPGVDAAGLTRQLAELARELGRADVADLCLAVARAQPWINSLVLGVDGVAQLERNLALLNTPPLTAAALERVSAAVGRVPEALLNPACWPPR